MKKFSARVILPVFIAALLLLLQSCVKDQCNKTYTYTYYEPVYKTTAEVRANIKSNAARAIEQPGKIYIKGHYIFLNEVNKGIHIIDNSNPAAPVNRAFIDLPGNVDIAIKENILYADFYTDLVAIDISNPMNVSAVKFVPNVFPERYYYGFRPDSSQVVTAWTKKTSTVELDCDGNNAIGWQGGGMLFNTMDAGLASSSGGTKSSPVGISGSLARFAIMDNCLYSVSNDSLRITNVTVTNNPVRANGIYLGWGMETIFPFKDKLFIGSNAGMLIYSVQTPFNPIKLGSFQHVRNCDPVIADDNYAYVTIYSGNFCAGTANQMEVLNISNILSPVLVKTYPLTNPRGLSKDGNLLFVCDGNDGLKVFNAQQPTNILLRKRFAMSEANDVIAFNNIALVVAADGLYQYDYSNADDIKLLSKMAVEIK